MASATPLRIILVGQSAFAEKCLEAVIARPGVEVIAVYVNLDTPERPEPARLLAEKHNIPVHQHKSLKATDAALEEWKKYQPDLALLAFVTQFVPDAMITLPRLGTACFHPSLLPKYRGGSALQWQIIKGETKGGLSWFWTEPATGSKVDTGPIAIQKEVEILPDDTSASVYFRTIFPLGVETCAELVDLCVKGDPPRIVQDEGQATWDPLCNDKVASIDWNKPCQEVHNFVRGCDPQPGAFTFHKGNKLRVYTSKLVSDVSGKPGEVLSIAENGVTIACASGGIRVGKMKGPAAKLPATEVASSIELSTGTVLSQD